MPQTVSKNLGLQSELASSTPNPISIPRRLKLYLLQRLRLQAINLSLSDFCYLYGITLFPFICRFSPAGFLHGQGF